MHLGFGFYRHMLNDEYFRFAVQCGATHAVVHLCDYGLDESGGRADNQPIGEENGWGFASHSQPWSVEEIVAIKAQLNEHGLQFYAIENFDPAQWHDILLDGPKRQEQMEIVKQQIRNVGEAGIPVFGYNFSLAGVAGRRNMQTRGGAIAVGLDGSDAVLTKPIPKGMVWNMIYDQDAPEGDLEPISSEALWDRYGRFLREIIPVAEKAGVTMAAHPDDPPLENLRNQPRLVYRHDHYQTLLNMSKSRSNQLEFCVGTLAEMQDDDLYGCIEKYSSQQSLAYVHLRNVHGKVPNYVESFIDDGDVDIGRVLKILNSNGFSGVVIPDHAPQMSCSAPWHAGMAYAMGYIQARLQDTSTPYSS